MNKNKVFRGVILIALAVALLFYAFIPDIALAGISAWKIIAGAVLIYWLINNICFGETLARRISVFLPLSLLFIVFESNIAKLLGKKADLANNWFVLLAGILLTIAVYVIFGKSTSTPRKVHHTSNENKNNLAASVIYLDVLSDKYHSIENKLGAMTVFFQNSDIDTSTDPITLNIQSKLGSITVNVPENWKVQNRIANNMSEISVRPDNAVPGRTLILEGSLKLGTLSVE